MDDKLFNQLLAGLDNASSPKDAISAPADQAGTGTGAQGAPQITDARFNELLAQSDAAQSTTAPAPHVGVPAPGQGEGPILPPVGSPEAFNPQGGQPGANEPGLYDPTRPVLDAAAAGVADSVYQTKDFLSGETPEDQKSAMRKNAEATGPDDGLGYSLTKSVAQFSAGLLGAGKLLAAAKGIKAVGAGVEALEGLRGGGAAIEASKAATVGAIAFDPHTERLSNLIQSSPALANPVNQFLAAKPDDSSATGRLKNALESLGMDAALVGVVGGAMKGYRALRDLKSGSGSVEDAVKGADDLGAAMDRHNAIRDRQEGVQPDTLSPAPSGEPDSAPPLTVTRGDAQQPIEASDAAGTSAGDPMPKPEAAEPAPAEIHTDLSGREFTKDNPEDPWVAKPKDDAEPSTTGDATAQSNRPEAATEATAPRPSMTVLPEQARSIYEGATSDIEAFERYGSWDAAVNNGHIFGKGGSIPYQKLVGGENGRTQLDAFITNTAEQLRNGLDAAKGGDVLSDARVDALVQQRYKLYGEDPAALVGLIQRAGSDANALVANMEASYGVAQRGYQDAYALAARIKAGDLTGFEDLNGAMEGLRNRLEVASSAWASGQAMRSASGRALRRMRSEFRLQPADMDALNGMDGNALVDLLNSTGGDPRAIKFATNPGLLREVQDWAQFLYTNNLLWGLRTHAINFSTNFYMVGVRPLERILGSLAQTAVAAHTGNTELRLQAKLARDTAMANYHFMGSVLPESWKGAVEAFKNGDSILAPHSNELAMGTNAHGDLGRQVAQLAYRPWDSLGNVTANALMVAAPKAIGLPSRLIGGVDELIKNIAYRSHVMAKAQVEGVGQGLVGDGLSDFVKNRLYAAFDDAGKATDAKALQEAKVSTFQQDLVPGTLGSAVQSLTGNVPYTKFILPFVRTPTNVIRTGWKMTPGLNMLQTEYRDTIRGRYGVEQQAQAIGQMAMGSLFMGLAAYLHHTGSITGGGPSNPILRNKLKATGWQPYSFVKTNDDGSLTYIPYGRFDPVAMPFGMVADIGDVLHQAAEDPNSKIGQTSEAMMLAVATSLAKAFSEKSYLKSVDDTIQFAMDPDAKASKWAGGLAANFVPAASLLRNSLNQDTYLRDARHFLDYTLQEIPGLSSTLPPKRDAFGDPITVHKGLWINSPGDLVDAELRRMGEKPDPEGEILGPPAARFKGEIDLRDITMVDGKNAYDHYQELARQPTPRAKPIKDVVAMIMQTDAYKNAPDGDSATKGTKMAIITKPMAQYREAASRMMMADKNVRDAAYKKQMATVSAYANRKANQNQTPQNATGDALGRLQGAFGNMLGGGAGTQH